ncbi:P-loop containing nucleoside triphosphate hydrolase protein [Lactarius hengduanensis]|nr:P-loop containing nucleoside triphosphate hydrolase protein [Lactarius hengduanensis]
MDAALQSFHDNKHIFVSLGIRDNFNIPKLHFAKHYCRSIKLFGTTDNFNTEYTERLHIDLAKDAYAATNHKDEFPQMALWLERKEKIALHTQSIDWVPPGLDHRRILKIGKSSDGRLRSNWIRLEEGYGAIHFRAAIGRWKMRQMTFILSIRRLQSGTVSNTFEKILGTAHITLYSLLFSWLTSTSTNASVATICDLIGLFDLPGSQNLTSRPNSLDQFCINFANERLQNFIQRKLFKSHVAEYNSEGIARYVPQVPYFDNSECLRLLQNQPGGLLH